MRRDIGERDDMLKILGEIEFVNSKGFLWNAYRGGNDSNCSRGTCRLGAVSLKFERLGANRDNIQISAERKCVYGNGLL